MYNVNMLGPLFGIVGVLIILVTGELFWRLRIFKGEFTREFTHILAGTFVAFWPFFMTFEQIQVIAGLAIIAIAVSRRYHIFQSIHAVKRRTYGEFFFPLSVLLVAGITDSKAIFVAAILHLSLADGLAAYIGTRYGQKNSYKILGQTKSLYGTAAFLATSLLIMAAALISDVAAFSTISVWLVVWLPVMATLTESIAVYGTDDLLVPLLVAIVLQSLQGIG